MCPCPGPDSASAVQWQPFYEDWRIQIQTAGSATAHWTVETGDGNLVQFNLESYLLCWFYKCILTQTDKKSVCMYVDIVVSIFDPHLCIGVPGGWGPPPWKNYLAWQDRKESLAGQNWEIGRTKMRAWQDRNGKLGRR